LVQGFCEIVTRGDYTLYVDPPGLIETSPMPATSLCLGPITWSAPVAKPAWWGSWSPDLPLIYFTSGSTGDAAAAAAMVRSLAELDATVLVATSGRFSVEASPSNVYLAEYLPGAEACSEASVVVCNGGSGTVQQALASGVPVLGFWKNLDQYLSAMTVEHAGGGLACHASGVSPEQARGLVRRLLDEPVITARAKTLAQFVAALNAQDRFRAFVRDVVA
jgi:UDP:flavonoid glycosyltransferase YjiC (YdhE family)